MLQVENKLPQDLRVEFLRPDGTVLAVPLPRGVTLVIDGLGAGELTQSAREVFVRRGHYTVREYGGAPPRPPVNWIVRGGSAMVAGAAAVAGALSFTPAGPPVLAGMAMRYDASLLGLADGTRVASWPDLSGNSRTATAVGNPVLVAGALNGLPVVRFTDSDRFALSCPQSANSMVFAVMKTAGSASYGLFLNRAYTSQGPACYASRPASPQQTSFYWDGAGGTVDYATTALASNGGYKIAGWQWDGTGIHLWENSAPSGGAFDSRVKANVDTWTSLGGDVGGSQTWHGDVGEVLVYNVALDITQRQAVENYLAAKWGIALAR